MAKRLQVYASRELVVTFDPNLCIHAAECLQGLPEVFDASRAEWIRPDAASAEAIAAVVARCPSAALQAIRSGIAPVGPAPPTPGVLVQVQPDGPTVIHGAVTVELTDGSRVERNGSVSLCRCGRTATVPFCDGTHIKAGFRSPA